MRRCLLPLFGLCLAAGAARAQAPDWAVLWRVAGTTLPAPAALGGGPAGLFWNPAAVADAPGLAGAVDVLHTPEVVNLGGLIGAVTYHLGRVGSVGVSAGRVSVGDLVRTTTSPVSETGEIPVFAQFIGAAAGTALGPFRIGAQLRLHDARIDFLRDDGATLDAGIRFAPGSSFVVAAATHFATPRLQSLPTTDYYLGTEYRFGTSRVWGEPAVISARYGVDIRATGEVDHAVGGGLAFGERLRVDAAFRREAAYGEASWRFVVGVAFRAGRYLIAAARGSGLNEVGAAYRIGLTAGLLR